MNTILELKDISKSFGPVKVLDGIDMTIEPGKVYVLAGENGAGKSTLMKTILGLQKPVEGQIMVGDGLAQNEIGYLPQQKASQKDFPASVREIVLSGCQGRCGLRPFYNTQEKELAEDAMERMQITDLARRCYRELSGGQQQRVLLARALCATQKMLLVDEPVSGLDPKATAQMYELLEELNEIDGITIIMISHDIAAAMKYASHILRVGKHTFFGTKDEYLEEYRRRKAYRRMIQKREAQKEEGEWQ